MSWFDIAKNALSTAQRSIDKVLEIEEGNGKQQDSKGRTNTTGSNQPTSKEVVDDTGSNDNSFWSLYKPNTHSTPKTGASHSTASSDFMSFDEDSQWDAYFSTPQPASLPRTAPKKAKGKTVQKHNESPHVVESSEVTKSLPSPGVRVAKSGPLKLGSPKSKSDTKPTQSAVHEKKPSLHSDHTSQATPQLASSTNDDSSIVSSSSMHENITSQALNQLEHIVSHSGTLEPVSSSEQLVEPKSTGSDAILPSSSTDDVAGKQDSQLIASTNVAQDEAVAILPVTSSEAPDSSQLSNTSSPSIDSYNVITSDEKAADIIDSSENKEAILSSSNTSRIREEIDAPQSGEISSTAEYIIVSKDNIVDELLDDENVSKQLTEPAPVETLAASSDAPEPRDLVEVEVKSKEDVSDHRNDDPSVDGVTQTVSCSDEGSADVPDHQVKKYEEELQNLNKEVARLNELLMARENKLVELSKNNINLRETEEILRHQLQQAEDNLQADQTGTEELKTEFTQRIATSEKKLQAVIKERDSLKNQVQVLQQDQKTSAEKQLAEELSSAKEQVTGLLEEGERLSKQQLQSNNIIKKLKAKDKESEKLIASLRQQVSENEAEIEKLSEALKKKDEKEKKYQESMAQLNTIAEQQAKELTTYKTECETLTDKARGLQTNLDNAYKEMGELHKTNALSQNAAQEATLSAEIAAKEQLKTVLEQHKMEARRKQEALTMQLAELQMSLNRSEHQTNWKEEHFKQEISDLQQRLQEAETRNQELTQSVSQATRPLLRQIDNLQSVHNAQTINWERVEESLSEKLVSLQSQLNMAVAREHAALEKEHVIQSKQTGLETQLTNTKQAKAQLLATLEMEKARAEAVQEELERERAKHNSLKSSYTQTLTDARKEKEALQRQLEYERIQSENEMKRLMEEVAQEKERERLASINKTQSELSRTSSNGSFQGSVYDRSVSMDGYSTGLGDSILRGSLTSASTVDRLQSTLKQREGELHNIQELVTSLERSRESLANDLANTSAQVQSLQEELKILPIVRDNLQKLQKNYDALLLMYGEKAEEAEELKLDLLDVKAMYRSQIEELLNKQR